MTQGEAHRLAQQFRAMQDAALRGPCGVHLRVACNLPPVGVVQHSDPPIAVCAEGKTEIERQGYNVVTAEHLRWLP